MSSAVSSRPLAAFVRTVLPAAIAAAVAVLVAYLLFDMAGADYTVTTSGSQSTVNAPMAGIMTLLMTLVGGGIALAIARRTARPGRTFVLLVALAVVVMAAGPLTSAHQGLTIAALEVLHLIAAATVLLIVLPRLGNRRTASS
ncbi:DUF6069 family protein [Streptomyces sp. NPDC002680]|uniref:DUF6069 family protein n=1 Tax=Streptomyces sp. NPDC002680 TaxID=3364659 RepID=UPI00368548F3